MLTVEQKGSRVYLYSRAKALRTNSSISLFSRTDTAQGCLCYAQDVQGAVMLLLMFESVVLGPC